MDDIGKGNIKCIVKRDDKEIEIGLPEKSYITDLKLKLLMTFQEFEPSL